MTVRSGGSFTHLHLHTEFSMLDGAARVAEVVAAAAADGQPAIGITDHGNMYGVLDFYRAARDAGLNPVIGSEVYMAADSRHERPRRRGRVDDTGGDAGDEGEKLYYHLTLLAENDIGYRNLMQLSSEAYLSGYFYKPRCLVAGQEIVTAAGVRPIEDVAVGDRVLTHRGRLRPVTQLMQRPFAGTLYGVRLNNRYGRVTWMTAEHPVLVRTRDGALQWVEVQDIVAGRAGASESMGSWNAFACLPKIRPDDPTVSIRTTNYVGEGWEFRDGRFVKETMRSRRGPTRHYCDLVEEIELDYDFGFFVGLYAAEGGAGRGEVRLTFHQDEVDLIDHCRRVVKRLTGKDVTVNTRPDRPAYRGVDVRVSSAPLVLLMKRLCGSGARDKHLPDFTFDAPSDFRQGVLDGVFAGDGAMAADATILTQTSKALAWQVRSLATNFTDSFAGVVECHDGDPNHAPQFRSTYAANRAFAYRRTIADDEYVYRPIAEILTKDYAGTVYNIEVDEDHSYVSDFAIHNCDWELLEQHHEGIIATTGCLGGVVLQALLKGDDEGALKRAARLQDIFGRDNLFVELQDHGLADQRRTNPKLIDIATKLGAPLLATNDSHYTRREDHIAHDALLCVQTGSSIDDPKRFKFDSDQHYLKTAAEMRALFSQWEVACDNTLWIAERAHVEIEFGKPQLPEFPLPDGVASDADYLRDLTFAGARDRYGAVLPGEVVERLEYELGVIGDMGFSAYFLIVWDLIRHAREQGIRVGPGRGSAAGCCVAYCLRIVDLDPIRYDLLFERFLNPGRKQMPDIDMDFDSRYRGEMIRYASEKYGWDHVAQIVTFSTIKARAAVRDAARVLGYPYAVGDKIAKAMPPLVMGRDTPLWACFDKTDKFADGYKVATELRDMYEVDPEARKVIDVARGLEGLRRQDGIHAAAVVITRDPLTTYLPIQRKPEAGAPIADAPIVTQYEMHGVEDLGLLKMDFLGLRNLDVMEMAVTLIRETTGEDVDIDAIPLDDDATLSMLRRGESIGVFQLEGGPMRALMRSLAPTSFDDVAALVALYRPGPMAQNWHNEYADRKNGRKPVEYFHPDAEEILADTYGLVIYQEGLMRAAQKFAGYTLEEADNLRKACGKKIRELIAKEREKFVDGCERTGYGRDLGKTLFDMIEPFADYAFNKSHSYGYGYVAYQTAYLKAHYPVQYLAALLTSVKGDKDKTAVYLAECRGLGIKVLVPDVNMSGSDFTAVDDTIPFGLSAVRNVGEGLVALLLAERDANGPFTDFYDFCDRVDPQVLNKRTLESLVKAGAFDSLGHPRKGLLLVFEQIVDRVLDRRRKEAEGQFDLFGSMGATDVVGTAEMDRIAIPDVEFDKSMKLSSEKEMLGLYISDHPLMGAEGAVRKHTEATIAELRELRDGDCRWVGGVVTSLQRKYTKRGDLMAVFVLEDLQSAIEVMVFPKTMMEVGHLLVGDAVVGVKGRLDLKEEPAKIMALEIKPIPLPAGGDAGAPVELKLPAFPPAGVIAALKRCLLEHPGDRDVILHVGPHRIRLSDQYRVSTENGFCGELRTLEGPIELLT